MTFSHFQNEQELRGGVGPRTTPELLVSFARLTLDKKEFGKTDSKMSPIAQGEKILAAFRLLQPVAIFAAILSTTASLDRYV
jgi:hypothetical protein